MFQNPNSWMSCKSYSTNFQLTLYTDQSILDRALKALNDAMDQLWTWLEWCAQYLDRSFVLRQSYPRRRPKIGQDQQLLETEILYRHHSKMIVYPFIHTKKKFTSNTCIPFKITTRMRSNVLTFTHSLCDWRSSTEWASTLTFRSENCCLCRAIWPSSVVHTKHWNKMECLHTVI